MTEEERGGQISFWGYKKQELNLILPEHDDDDDDDIPKFSVGSTCFEWHTAHHQELQTVFAASGLYTHVVTGRCPGSVGTRQRPVTTWVYKPQAANTVWSSWWWAVCRLKHVEPSINFRIINSITRLHLVGYFYWLIVLCFPFLVSTVKQEHNRLITTRIARASDINKTIVRPPRILYDQSIVLVHFLCSESNVTLFTSNISKPPFNTLWTGDVDLRF